MDVGSLFTVSDIFYASMHDLPLSQSCGAMWVSDSLSGILSGNHDFFHFFSPSGFNELPQHFRGPGQVTLVALRCFLPGGKQDFEYRAMIGTNDNEALHGSISLILSFLHTGVEWVDKLMIKCGFRRIAVLDLPQLYTKPSTTDLLMALDLLTVLPGSFGSAGQAKNRQIAQPASVSRYLTSIISSSLSWLESDEVREAIWDAAAARLSQHSGRAGKLPSEGSPHIRMSQY
jgi:hypothetical protein